MNPKQLFRRATALLTAIAISVSLAVYSGTTVVNADSTQAQLESELADIKKKQDEIDKAIKETKGDISHEKENQEKIDEQIKTTEEYIRTLTDLIKEFNLQIEGLELDISARQAGILVYEKQLRVMYISGEDSYASVLAGASNFFDMLMKMELVKRVADSNNEFIGQLISIKDSYEQNKADLQDKVKGLENAISEMENKKAPRPPASIRPRPERRTPTRPSAPPIRP